MELDEYIKDGFSGLLHDYIRPEEYVEQKRDEWFLTEFYSDLSRMQK